MLNQIIRSVFESSIERSPGVRKGSGHASRLRAFSVLELAGVLAIIAILAAAIIPSVIRRIDRAAWERERSDLSAMANWFVQAVVTDKRVPATIDIPATIANYSATAISQISTNPRGLRRVFMVDPSLVINGAGLPYNQDNNGSSLPPANPRFVILSAIAGPSVSTISNAFATIWNTPDGGKPSTWTGKAEDLCIQRVDLATLFHKLYLLNIDPDNDGWYTFETNAVSSVQHGNTSLTAYVLDGTSVNLYQLSDPTNLEARVIVSQDESYVYQNNRWSRSLSSDELTLNLQPQSFGWWVQQFLLPPAPPNPQFGANQQAVIDEMYTYLSSYILWANGDPSHNPPIVPFQGTGWGATAAKKFPYYSVLPDVSTRLGNVTGNLIQP